MNSSLSVASKTAFFLLILHLCLFVPIASTAADFDTEKDLQGLLEQSRGVVHKIRETGHSSAADTARLKNLLQQIKALDLIFLERFRLAGERAQTVSSTAADRHAAMVEGYKTVMEQYAATLEEVPAGEAINETVAARLEQILDQAHPKKKTRILGTLPYKVIEYPAVEPKDVPSLVPAYRNGATGVTADDLKGTPEAPISKEITALAQALNWQPVAIYEWVKNNVDTEWYSGCMKGAEETLHQKSGNDCDQAALLVSLMRASGYPSRYLTGVIEFFPGIERVQNLTGIDDPLEIAEFFRHAGIAFKPVLSGSRIDNFQIEHVWVETQVPYGNYRGALKDSAGKTWLALDTSIKAAKVQWNTPAQLTGVSLSDVRDRYLSASSQLTPLDFLQGEVEQYLKDNHPEQSYGDLLRVRTATPEVLNILPSSLQFAEVKVTQELSSIPETLLHKVTVTAADPDGKVLFEKTLAAFNISNRKLVLSYEPENVEDHQIIDVYGGLDNTPSYLVRLRPVLKLNDERLAVGTDGLPMGSDYTVTVSVTGPRGTETVSGNHIVGNLSVLSVVAQKSVTPAEVPAEEKDAERILYEEALKYNANWYDTEELLASLLHLTPARPLPSVIFLGGVVDVAYVLGTPHGFAWKGAYLDAALRRVYGGAAQGSGLPAAATRKDFMLFSALQGSVLEHRLFEDDFQVEAVSTARLFGVLGGQVLTIDAGNIDAVLPALPYDEEIKNDIASSVAQNYQVKIPAAPATFRDWTGTGYVKENPDTGEAGYMLSGMIAGGMTAWALDSWPEYYAAYLSSPYAEAKNTDPLSAASIQKLTKTDLQMGTVGENLSQKVQVKVTDRAGKAVPKAKVNFTIMAGGGSFASGGATYQAVTNATGIASATVKLGQRTAANPTYWWKEGYTYVQQIGENVIAASLASSGTSTTKPFTAYAFPKSPAKLEKISEDEVKRPVLTYYGSLSVIVEDVYGNPIANQPVTFTAQAPTPQGATPCGLPNADVRTASLVKTGDTCTESFPVWGQCAQQSATIEETSSTWGASADLIMGGVPDAAYTVSVSSANVPAVTYTLYTDPFGNCNGTDPPANELYIIYTKTTDNKGNALYAGKAGSTLPITVKVFYLREGIKEILETLSCNGPRDCTKIVGNRTYFTDTNFKLASVTFSGLAGAAMGNGVYQVQYPLATGLNQINIAATATVTQKRTYSLCQLCNVIQTVDITASVATAVKVWGVQLQLTPLPPVHLDRSGFLKKDYALGYSIAPADFKGSAAYVQVKKAGAAVSTLDASPFGTGSVTLSKGYFFDTNSSYAASLVLQAYPAAITSDEVPIKGAILDIIKPAPLDKIQIKTDTSGKPAMPSLKAEVLFKPMGYGPLDPAAQPFCWDTKVEYLVATPLADYRGRTGLDTSGPGAGNDGFLIPQTGCLSQTGTSYTLDWGGKFGGGLMDLRVSTMLGGSKLEEVFHGKLEGEPMTAQTQTAMAAYLRQAANSSTLTTTLGTQEVLFALACVETGMKHFCPSRFGQPKKALYPTENSLGDGGYGMMQLTNGAQLPMRVDFTDGTHENLPSYLQIWNWRENVNASITIVNEKIDVARKSFAKKGVTLTPYQLKMDVYALFRGGHYWKYDKVNKKLVPRLDKVKDKKAYLASGVVEADRAVGHEGKASCN